jgi:hypothetical protein
MSQVDEAMRKDEKDYFQTMVKQEMRKSLNM